MVPIDDSDKCDRRLSRAAREILVNRALPILQHYDKYLDGIKLSSLTFEDKMDYYKTGLSNLMHDSKTCLLNPKNDSYWHEENLHKVVKSRNKRFSKQNLHVCGLCGKKFISKYYLDIHVETKHKNDHIPRSHNHEICPANEICDKLGPNTCQQQAAIDEPYYAPGVHNHDDLYSQSIKRKYQNEAHAKPCSDSSVEECHEMFETCFGGSNESLTKDLTTLFCDTQSCDAQLHSILNEVMSIHDGREEWNKYQDEVNSFGWRHILYIIFLLIYFFNSIQKFIQNRLKKKRAWDKAKKK